MTEEQIEAIMAMVKDYGDARSETSLFNAQAWPDGKAVRMPIPRFAKIRAALATPAPAQPDPLHVANERGEGEARGIEKAARWVDRRRDEYEDEHGTVDPETGSMEFGRGPSGQAKQDYVETLWEIAEGIRALSAAPKEKP